MGGGSAGHIYLYQMSRTTIAALVTGAFWGRWKDGGVATHLLPWHWMAIVLESRAAADGSERACQRAAPRQTAQEGWPSLRVEGKWKM